MAKLNTFKNSSGSTRAKKRKNTTISYQKRTQRKSFDRINFSEGQRKALKIIGLFLLLLSGLFLVAFLSYLFTWKADQSYIAVSNGGLTILWVTNQVLYYEFGEITVAV